MPKAVWTMRGVVVVEQEQEPAVFRRPLNWNVRGVVQRATAPGPRQPQARARPTKAVD